MKYVLSLFILLGFSLSVYAQKPEPFNGLHMDLGNLYRLSDAKTRSISPENFTGEPGKGGMTLPEKGNAGHEAHEFCYQAEPHASFPPLLSKNDLEVN